ncbi:MAG: hypothetical protein QUS08_06015 [Methanothrix sp.]|nr:hypothetical protein [Methanothrix sp.]
MAVIMLMTLVPGLGEHYVMEIGSKSNPNAHLFAYDEKFRESTYLHNYQMNMSASKEFTDATRLSTRMELSALPNITAISIDADFIGIGRLGYLVLDPETGDVREEYSRIDHMFIGNFSLDEEIIVAKDHMEECWYLPCA